MSEIQIFQTGNHFNLVKTAHLISIHPIEKSDTDDGGREAGTARETRKARRLHLNVANAELVEFAQEVELVLLFVVTEVAIETHLTYGTVFSCRDPRTNPRKSHQHTLSFQFPPGCSFLFQRRRGPHGVTRRVGLDVRSANIELK